MNLTKLFYKYKEILLYLLFGVLTTHCKHPSILFVQRYTSFGHKSSNIVAWVISVVFAFLTNKHYVFHSSQKEKTAAVKEGVAFLSSRVFSLIIDMILMMLMIDVLRMISILAKIVSNVVVIVANYILSKFFVFKQEKKQ